MIPQKYVLMQQGYVDSIVPGDEEIEEVVEVLPDIQAIVADVSRDANNRLDLFELLCSEFPEVAKEVLNPDVYLIVGS